MGLLPTKPNPPKQNLEDFILYLYGKPGIGKSTFCSQFPSPVFAATEKGLNSLTTYDVPIDSWDKFLLFCKEIDEGKHSFKTIIIDTVDNLYKFCLDAVCKKHNMAYPTDKDYGQGWALVRDEFMRIITKLSLLPYGLVFVSHSQLEEVKTRTGQYNTASPTCPKQANELITNIADLMLYMESIPTEGGNESRVLHTKPSAYWIAKDKTKRNIPADIELPIEKENEMFLIFNSAFMGGPK